MSLAWRRSGKHSDVEGRGRCGQLVVCVIKTEVGADSGEVAGDAVASAVVGEFGGLDVSRGPRYYIIEYVGDACSRATSDLYWRGWSL